MNVRALLTTRAKQAEEPAAGERKLPWSEILRFP